MLIPVLRKWYLRPQMYDCLVLEAMLQQPRHCQTYCVYAPTPRCTLQQHGEHAIKFLLCLLVLKAFCSHIVHIACAQARVLGEACRVLLELTV